VSSQRVTWLHISDAHFGGPDMVGESQSVIAMLLQDLERLRDERGLVPDLLFFTGDIAFGETPRSHLEDQYQAAEELLMRVEELFRVERSNVFLVPGNHDVNRTRVTEADTNWLDSHLGGAGADATRPIDQLWAEPETVAYQRYLERLENYAAFIQRAGLKHLLQNPRGLGYTHRRDVNGIDVAITGINTAWSSCRDKEKGKLWLGQRQVKASAVVAINADLSIALGHHPPGWFNEHEDPAWYQFLSSHYHFYLHGHEHNDWVVDQGAHVRVAAGCLYERNLATTGYNFVRLDFKERSAEVFLRQYDAKGGGWVPRPVFKKTDDSGRWKLGFVPLRKKYRADATASDAPPSAPPVATDSVPPPPALDVYEHFETGRAVREEDRFIGRRSELRTALGALRARGAAIAIFGEAGFGKTSLALEVARIATGRDTKLCESAELRGCVPKSGFAHHVVYYSCRLGVDVDLETTLESVLRDRVDSHVGRVTTHPEFQKQLSRPEYADVKREHEAFHRRDSNGATALGLFRSVGGIAYEAFGRELVVILDEFDVISDKRGFATLIKELPQVKFVLVGTAVDVRLLVQEHASVPRQLAEGQIRLRPMSREELAAVITNEEARGRNRFSFTPQAKYSIADAARGVPYFVHFLGRHALDLACRDESLSGASKVLVELRHVEQALQERLVDLVDLEKEYLDLVDGRWEREVVLKLLAARNENPIFVGNVRAIAEKLGVKKLETPLRAFVKRGVLVREAEAMYQFSDTRLKVYARLREPVTDVARRRLSHHDSEPVSS
jgi:predicted MPP superfamily phosphohydrolase